MKLASFHLAAGVLVFVMGAAYAKSPNVLTADGIGPIRVGMTLQQLETAIGRKVDLSDISSDDTSICADVAVPGWKHVGLLMENFRIAVIYIDRPYRTIDGVYYGMSEADLKRRFGRRAVFDYRPYFGDDPHAHNVVVKKSRRREFLFQTKDDKVSNISVGDLPGVEYWEGCV